MALVLTAPKTIPIERRFSPYDDNGGSIVAVAGNDFAVIASDTRLSTGYSIYTRDQSKLFKLSEKSVLGCGGCWCDSLSLTKLIEARMQMYLHEHQKVMSTPAIAEMLSRLLYYKRFFPYYVSNIVAGLDQDGKGVLYAYDPIGHFYKTYFKATGSAGPLLQPVLDNQFGKMNVEENPDSITLEKAITVVRDAFISATERDIYTGDSIIMHIITKDGLQEQKFELRKD